MSQSSRRNVLLALAGQALLLPAPPARAQGARPAPPTILERRAEERAKNPALDEKLARAAAVMHQAAWMAGKWDVVETTFGTSRTPESSVKGTREVVLELDGRSLVARQTAGALKTLEVLVYDPYRENWFLQILTNGGRSIVEPLVGTSGWVDGTLQLQGRLWLYGLNAEINFRIVKEGNDAFREVIEERLPGNVARPVFEFRCSRPGAGAPPKQGK